MMPVQRALPSLLLLAAAVLSSWMVINSLQTPLDTPESPQNPDSFVINTMAIRMKAIDGSPQDQLFTPLMVHYPQGDTTNITTPHLIIFNANEEPWHIYAEKGQAQKGIAILELWDKVKLIQAAGPKNQALTAITNALTIFPKIQYAQTKQPVTLWQTAGIASAIGLRANLKTGVIDLLTQARGQYFGNAKN